MLWGTYSGNETLSKPPEVVSSEVDIDAGKPWAGGLRTEEAVPVIPGRRTCDGKPPGTGRVRLLEVSPTTGCRSEAGAGRGAGLGRSSAFGRRGSGERFLRRGRNFGRDSAGRQKESLPHLPPARPFPPPRPPPPPALGVCRETRCACGFRRASSQRGFRARCPFEGTLEACFQSSRRVCDW